MLVVLAVCLCVGALLVAFLRTAIGVVLHTHSDLNNAATRAYPDVLLRYHSLVSDTTGAGAGADATGVDDAPVDYPTREARAFPHADDEPHRAMRQRVSSAIGLLVDRLQRLEHALQPS